MKSKELLGENIIKAMDNIEDELLSTDKEILEIDIQKQEQNFSELELFMKYDYQKSENDAVTSRWINDVNNIGWLNKNVRPVTLMYILTVYTFFSIGGAFGMNVPSAYVELLGQWGMLIMSAYFGGRTIEKIMLNKNSDKDETNNPFY
jgi:hypothetical protein